MGGQLSRRDSFFPARDLQARWPRLASGTLNMGAFIVAAAGSAFAAWLMLSLEMIPWRRSAAEHWTIRARHLFPVRVAAAMNLWLFPFLCVMVGWAVWRANWFALGLGGLVGATVGGYLIDREVSPETAGRAWAQLLFITLGFRLFRWAALAAAIFFMPVKFGGLGCAIAAGFLLAVLTLECGVGLRVLRWIGFLHVASPRLKRIVDEARADNPVPVRAIWELSTPEANAFAMTSTRGLVFTRVLLKETPDDELRAICVHELVHLAESRWTMMARILGRLAVFPILFYRPVDAAFGLNGVVGLVGMVGIVCWLRSRLSHVMEKHADRAAVQSVVDSATYARGLERIYRLNRMPVVQRKSGLNTHPDLYDRLIAAAVTPDYPRPEPPRRLAWSSAVLTAVCTVLFLSMVFKPG